MPDETKLTLVVSDLDYKRLREALLTSDGYENFGILYCGQARGADWQRLLVREVAPAPSSAYRERLPYHLEIEPAFFNTIIDRSLKTGLSPVIVHSHPGHSRAQYSPSDDFGESRLLPVLRQLVPSLSASLLLTATDVIGRRLTDSGFAQMEAVEVKGVDSLFFRTGKDNRRTKAELEKFDRQVRAIGERGQSTVDHLRIAVVGLGGTGSAVAEQLARLGVRDLILIDPDRLERSNLSRVYGSVESDAALGALKVDVVAAHLSKITGDAAIRVLTDSVVRQSVLLMLRDRDVVFGCTDNHLSRSVLNRFAHQYLVPVVDMGLRLDARKGKVSAVGGRVSISGAGMVCLRCSGHIDPELVRAESLPDQERRVLQREGYIQGLPEYAPSVISLNTTLAGLAVTAGLGLFMNLVGARPPLDQLYDATRGVVFTATPRHEPSCDICSPEHGLKGLGDAQVVTAYD